MSEPSFVMSNIHAVLIIADVSVRKAYKKKALQTHPDRLGPNITAEQKEQSEELFRKVGLLSATIALVSSLNLF